MSSDAGRVSLQSERHSSAQPDTTGATIIHDDATGTDDKETVITTSGPGRKENKKEKKRRHAKERLKMLEDEKKRRNAAKAKVAEDKRKEAEEKARRAELKKAIEEEIHKWVTIDMDDFPLGYPRQAAFQTSKPSFSIYRAFDYLHARVILNLQDELRCLEDELAELDADDFYSGNARQKARVTSRDADMIEARLEAEENAKERKAQNNGRSSDSTVNEETTDPISERAILLAKIENKLLQYDEILVKAREMAEFQRPSNRDYFTFRTWFSNYKPLSYEAEEDFIRRKGDLITLRPRAEWGKFDGWIEAKMPKMLSTFFNEDEPHADTRDPFTSYYSVSRIEKFTTLIIAFVIIILLAVPVFVMYRVSWQGGRGMTFLNVGLLIVFSLFFSTSMSLLTKAKRAELFAASAAYSAVLIVFIGNFAGKGDDSASS